MINKKLRFILFFSLIIPLFLSVVIIFVSGFLNENKSRPENSFSCTSKFVVHDKNLEVKLVIDKFFEEKIGTMILSGVVLENKKKVGDIHREVYFDYTRGDNVYVMKSRDVNVGSGDDQKIEFLEKYMPDFFFKKDKILNLGVFKMSKKAYVFFKSDNPVFFCNKE